MRCTPASRGSHVCVRPLRPTKSLLSSRCVVRKRVAKAPWTPVARVSSCSRRDWLFFLSDANLPSQHCLLDVEYLQAKSCRALKLRCAASCSIPFLPRSGALQHMTPMSLSTLGDGEDAHDLRIVIHVEVDDGSVLRHVSRPGPDFRSQRSLRGNVARCPKGFPYDKSPLS